jgi:hypothetical protein
VIRHGDSIEPDVKRLLNDVCRGPEIFAPGIT